MSVAQHQQRPRAVINAYSVRVSKAYKETHKDRSNDPNSEWVQIPLVLPKPQLLSESIVELWIPTHIVASSGRIPRPLPDQDTLNILTKHQIQESPDKRSPQTLHLLALTCEVARHIQNTFRPIQPAKFAVTVPSEAELTGVLFSTLEEHQRYLKMELAILKMQQASILRKPQVIVDRSGTQCDLAITIPRWLDFDPAIERLKCAFDGCETKLHITDGTWPHCEEHTNFLEGLELILTKKTKYLRTTRTFSPGSVVTLFSGRQITRIEYNNMTSKVDVRSSECQKFACHTPDCSTFLEAKASSGHNGRFSAIARGEMQPNVAFVLLDSTNGPLKFPAFAAVAICEIFKGEQIVAPREDIRMGGSHGQRLKVLCSAE
jgi:hypothetical protein